MPTSLIMLFVYRRSEDAAKAELWAELKRLYREAGVLQVKPLSPNEVNP